MDRRKIDINFNGVRHAGMEKLYRGHLRTLANPPKKVDNSAPTLAVACYYNHARVASERFRLVNIELENRMLLQLINEIYRTKGKVDTGPPAMSWSTNFYERVYKNKKLEKSNRKLYEILKHVKPTLSKAQLDRDYKRALEKMMFQARYTDYYSSLVPDLERWDICPNNMTDRRFCNVKKRVQCYMDIAIDDPRTSPDKLIKLGRLYIEIYRDYAPVTADNFLHFIKGYEGKSYKGTQFFRIQKCIGCVGGDVECNDGGGYYGIGSKCFPDENHLLQFNGPGVISTFTLFPGHNHSHFFISFQKLEPLNGKFVVFGRVIKTTSVLERIEECGTISGTPIQRVVVADCGFLGNSGSDWQSVLKAKKTSDEKKTSQTSGVLVRGTVRPEEPLKSSLVSSSQKISINTGDVEQAVSNLHQPTGPFALGNSGFLSQECTLERQALYSHLVRSYKWTDKIHEYSSLAAQLLGQNQLKRSYIVAGSNKRRRIQTSCHNVPIQTVDQVISAIDRQYPDMNLTVSRPFITNAVLQITLGKVLQAVIAFKGLLIEWVVIKGHGETLDLWTESRHKVFRKITENSHAAMLHFSSPAMPELAVRSFMTWLHSYISLFSEPCKRCGNHLHCALPPTWRDFRTLEAHHEECKV